MVVENFSQRILGSGLFRLYIAAGFFGSLIFFVLNANTFTPLEMAIGIIFITIGLKGLANLMFSLIVLFFDLDKAKEELDFKYNNEKINSLLSELNVQKTEEKKVKDNK